MIRLRMAANFLCFMIGLVGWQTGCFADEPIHYFQNGIRDQLTTSSGARYYLNPNAVTYSRARIPSNVAQKGKNRPFAIEFISLAVDPAFPNRCLALACIGENRKDGFAVLSIGPDGSEEILYRTRWHLKSPTIVPLDTGAFAIACDSGSLFVVGRDVQVEYSVPGKYPLQRGFPKLEIQVVGKQVVFYHPALYDRDRPFLRSPIVYSDGKLFAVTESETIGPTTIWNESTTVTLLQDAIVFDDFVSKKRIKSVPRSNTGLIPTRIFRDPKGELVAQFRNAFFSARHYDAPALGDGRFHQLMHWNGETFEALSVNRDRQLYQLTFEVQSPSGSWWLSSGDELLERNANGEWKRWNETQGLFVTRIDRIRFETDRILWLFENKYQTAIRVNLDLLETEPIDISNRMHHEHVRTYRSGTGVRVDWLLDGGEHLRVTTSAFQVSVPMPDRKSLIRQEGVGLWVDSQRNPWIIGESDDGPTCRWNGREWLCYETEDRSKGPQRRDSFRLACEAAWKNEPEGFEIANRVRLFKKGIAALDRNSCAALFDGSRWYSESKESRKGLFDLTSMDWDGERIRVLDKKQSPFELDLGNLDPTEFEPTVWPWEKLHVRPSKKVDAPDKKKIHWVLAKNAIPSPFEKVEWFSGDILHFSNKKLAIRIPDRPWSQLDFPFQLTPRLLSNIQFDPAGNLILCLDEGRIENRLVIDAERIPCRLARSDLGSFDDPGIEVPLELQSDSMHDIWVRYRVDPFPWSEWMERPEKIRLPSVDRIGKQTLQLEVHYAEHFARVEKLELDFSVTYQLEDRIRELIQRLDSERFAVRDDAYRKLESLGHAIVLYLPKFHDGASREGRARIQDLLSKFIEPPPER